MITSKERIDLWRADDEYEDKTVIKFTKNTVTTNDGWSLAVDDGEPQRNDRIRLHGRGIGFPVRGVALKTGADPWRVVRYETADEAAASLLNDLAQAKAEREQHDRDHPVPDTTAPYSWRPGMGEISGFGGGYEQTCRNMLAAALRWFDAHPAAAPGFKGYKHVMGVLIDDNADAKALSKAATDAADGDCTGAMHQAVIESTLWIRRKGWEAYCTEMSQPKQNAPGADA